MSKNVQVTYRGIGFTGLLTLAFIVLKLTGFIDWSWFWVLFPAILSVGFSLFLVFVAMVIVAITIKAKHRSIRKVVDSKRKYGDGTSGRY